MNKNIVNLILGAMCLILGLLFVSCTKQDISIPTQKVKPNIAPDRPLTDSFVVRRTDKLQ
jgi:hypothetical protein